MNEEYWKIVIGERDVMLKYLKRRYHQSEQWCEDMISAGMIRACERIGNLKDESKFKSWLWTIVINMARNELRLPIYKRHVEFTRMSVDSVQYEIIRDMEHDRILENVIAGLSWAQGTAFRLRYVDEMTFGEIAKVMDCAYDTAKANFRHAFLRVKDYLIERIL